MTNFKLELQAFTHTGRALCGERGTQPDSEAITAIQLALIEHLCDKSLEKLEKSYDSSEKIVFNSDSTRSSTAALNRHNRAKPDSYGKRVNPPIG